MSSLIQKKRYYNNAIRFQEKIHGSDLIDYETVMKRFYKWKFGKIIWQI